MSIGTSLLGKKGRSYLVSSLNPSKSKGNSNGQSGGGGGSGGSGGGDDDMAKLAQTITSGSQATVTFSAISQLYNNLIITVIGKDTQAANALDGLFIMFNGDNNSANYLSSLTLSGTGSSATSQTVASSAQGGCVSLTTGSSTANADFVSDILIIGYASTVWRKCYMGRSIARSNASDNKQYNGRWESTAAITSVTLSMSTAFVDGSIVTLYGTA